MFQNCVDVDEKCESWSPFYEDEGDSVIEEDERIEKTQICSDMLLNEDDDPDKLLYYNRVLTAGKA